MSLNSIHCNAAGKAPLKPPLTVSHVNQNTDRNKRMSKYSGSDGFYQPPDKRRKTDQEAKGIPDIVEDWDDDDFTQDQLENIDEMVMLSQQVGQQKPFDGNHNSKKITNVSTSSSSRLLGKGTSRSQSASDVHTVGKARDLPPTGKARDLPPTYPGSKTQNQNTTQRKATGKLSKKEYRI